VVGNVNHPGTFPLTKPITVVEAISLAGGLAGGGSVAFLVRPKPGQETEKPRLPESAPAGDKIKISLPAALAGDPRNNLVIKNGDTLYVPALFYYVQGQVKKAGRFPFQDNMTVLMAVTTAGGFTDKAAPKRTHIIREKDGSKEKIKVSMDDPIQPGDVVTVPESWF
jgi:polysaccharide export outer membrane protein